MESLSEFFRIKLGCERNARNLVALDSLSQTLVIEPR